MKYKKDINRECEILSSPEEVFGYLKNKGGSHDR